MPVLPTSAKKSMANGRLGRRKDDPNAGSARGQPRTKGIACKMLNGKKNKHWTLTLAGPNA